MSHRGPESSDHRWFEDRAAACTLLVYVDDATGQSTQLHFVPAESAFAYVGVTRAYLERPGKKPFGKEIIVWHKAQTSPLFCSDRSIIVRCRDSALHFRAPA